MAKYEMFEKESPFVESEPEPEVQAAEEPKEEPKEETEPEEKPKEEVKAAEEKPEKKPSESPPEKPKSETPEAEAETKDAPAETKEPPDETKEPEPEPTDVTIDGRKYELDDVREALAERAESRTRFRQAKEIADHVRQFRKDVTENTADTLQTMFSQFFGGDDRKAFEHLSEIAMRITYQKMQYDDWSEEQKQQFFDAISGKRAKAELERLKTVQKTAADAAADEDTFKAKQTELVNSLKDFGIEPSTKNVGELAAIILDERSQGLPDDPKRSLRRLRQQLQEDRTTLLKSLRADDIPEDIREEIRRRSIEEVKKGSSPAAKPAAKPKPTGRSKRSKYTRYTAGGFLEALDSMDD